jgi:hypothetical protein
MTEIDTFQYEPVDHADEISAIRELVATVERVQQQELVDEFVELFRSDAIWTTGHGKRLFAGTRLPNSRPRYCRARVRTARRLTTSSTCCSSDATW